MNACKKVMDCVYWFLDLFKKEKWCPTCGKKED